MPALTDPFAALILVSGANGFLASWIVGDLLKNGYSVRAAVRSEDKGQHLLKAYAEYGSKLQLSIVQDMSIDGAFDEAVKGVEGIIHTTSPVHLDARHPKEMSDPAIAGQMGMLKSALKHGSALRRVIITSSCSAILDTVPDPTKDTATVSESDWNILPVEECERLGSKASGLAMYSASKILAEKGLLLGFVEEQKAEISWDLTMIIPPFIFGVRDEERPQPELRDVLLRDVHGRGGPVPRHVRFPGWIDVRDSSTAHVRALSAPATGGERILVCGGSFVWQDFIDTANALSPRSPNWKPLAKGTPGQAHRAITFVATKQKEILGIEYRTMEQTTRDILDDWAAHGW
ncbi:D-lactaldehyde dehydrogenase [Mycena albidolilacea]|uniref:D-lactaldehyde dehydrogenase n=1 Tax=Mycena albidolilacea TaxID=1033008 RepID=A0AAD7AHR2_9AGAR|nr:D-lactaldehyde dehydrogenase [Mycena albidolilacea]